MINNNITNSEVVHKYPFKSFYKKNNKKKYKSQILKYNICYINVIVIQNAILIAKILVERNKKRSLL